MRSSDWSSDVCSSDLQDRATAICRFCDTDFVGTDGAGGGKFAEATGLVAAVEGFWGAADAHRFVVLTGGEPMLQVDDALVAARSEEHTSELQSLMRISYAVFCLKKKQEHHHTRTHTKHHKSQQLSPHPTTHTASERSN